MCNIICREEITVKTAEQILTLLVEYSTNSVISYFDIFFLLINKNVWFYIVLISICIIRHNHVVYYAKIISLPPQVSQVFNLNSIICYLFLLSFVFVFVFVFYCWYIYIYINMQENYWASGHNYIILSVYFNIFRIKQ